MAKDIIIASRLWDSLALALRPNGVVPLDDRRRTLCLGDVTLVRDCKCPDAERRFLATARIDGKDERLFECGLCDRAALPERGFAWPE